ncbi:hypothetical protein [Wansuia hejianensis]|uniref:Uncharacterized protein n=1 Tax=Wansuia hejianensis TaxID=2763667 RepID=A0A926EXY2_9FIRM|nr:hypothetical protein [Wansuia hejianensis]MBC8589611.1 hypothetical protein [Wansuia hejianensis]
MIYDNIIEKRIVDDGLHSLVLEIGADEYHRTYDEYSNSIANSIVNKHLKNRGDDGRVSNVRIEGKNENNIVKIYADVHYLGNDHTDYGIH